MITLHTFNMVVNKSQYRYTAKGVACHLLLCWKKEILSVEATNKSTQSKFISS